MWFRKRKRAWAKKKRGMNKERKKYIVRICGSESGRKHRQRKRGLNRDRKKEIAHACGSDRGRDHKQSV
jgi:hypothetical protein